MDSVTEINVMQPSIAQISKQKQQEKDKKPVYLVTEVMPLDLWIIY